MRKGRDGGEKNGGGEMEKMENNDENCGQLTLLPVDRLTATNCSAAACAKMLDSRNYLSMSTHAKTLIRFTQVTIT